MTFFSLGCTTPLAETKIYDECDTSIDTSINFLSINFSHELSIVFRPFQLIMKSFV